MERGVRSEKVYIIYPVADDDFFRPARRRADIRGRFGIDGKVVVGFLGSMSPYMRVDLLLRAAMEVGRVPNNIHFLIVGDGETMSDLTLFAKDNRLERLVTFTGRVPYEEVPEYCGAMDICVVPHATWYGSPTKLFEYAATGKPIIAPRMQSMQDLIRHGENGILTEVDDVGDLTKNILNLASNPLLRHTLGMKSREEMVRQTWSRNTDKLIDIFKSIR